MDNKWEKCKARFPREVHERSSVDHLGTVILKKLEPWINTFTPLFTYLFRCNTDVTSLKSGTAVKAVIMYVSDYITKTTLKTHTIFDTIRSVFHKNSEVIGGTLPMREKAQHFMTKVVNLLSAKAEMGAPMISMYLLGHPDHYTGHKFIPFYWKSFVSETKGAFPNNDTADPSPKDRVALIKKRGKFVGLSPVQDYVHRAKELQHVSLYEWVRCYERVKISAGGKKLPEDLDSSDEVPYVEQPYEASLESVPERDLPLPPMKKDVFRFEAAHPLSDSHASRYVKNNDLRVPSFIDATLPRRDKGDREYYCCTMLTLFKPWRSGFNLKSEDVSWDESFNAYHFTEEQEGFMNNFNIRYECLDARDNHRAQLKKNGGGALFNSWDPTELEGEELPESGPQAHNNQYDSGESELQTGALHLKHMHEMESVKLMLSLLGWTAPKEDAV